MTCGSSPDPGDPVPPQEPCTTLWALGPPWRYCATLGTLGHLQGALCPPLQPHAHPGDPVLNVGTLCPPSRPSCPSHRGLQVLALTVQLLQVLTPCQDPLQVLCHDGGDPLNLALKCLHTPGAHCGICRDIRRDLVWDPCLQHRAEVTGAPPAPNMYPGHSHNTP